MKYSIKLVITNTTFVINLTIMRRYCKSIVLFSFLFFNSLFILAQKVSIPFEDIAFTSDIEQRTIQTLMDGNGEVFDALLAISPEDSLYFAKWKDFYQREIREMKNRKRSKKVAKDVKYIYDALHEKFLRKYQPLAYFDEIFERGVYNCVTAVALYAMSFEALGIPYGIKETPTHVYIVADPEASQLLIETTDPVSGFKTFSPGFKESYIAQLAMLKLVDQSDVATKGIYPLFDEFYFGGSDLTLQQLVGIQYYNKGVSLFENKDYHAAWSSLLKARLFHSNQQINDLLFASLANALSGSDYSEWEDIKLLPYLGLFKAYDVKKTNVTGEFSRMLNYVLIENSNVEMAEKAFQFFISKTEDDEIVKEVTYRYNYEKGRIAYNRGNYQESFGFMTMAYGSKPGNANAESLLTDSFRLAFRNKPAVEALATLDTLMTAHVGLKDNNHLNTMKLNLYLVKMGEDFDSKKTTSGNQMRELFEMKVEADDTYSYDKNILGNAYSKAAVYYFKRGYTSKARALLKAGLKYAPDSYELKSRLRMINN